MEFRKFDETQETCAPKFLEILCVWQVSFACERIIEIGTEKICGWTGETQGNFRMKFEWQGVWKFERSPQNLKGSLKAHGDKILVHQGTGVP